MSDSVTQAVLDERERIAQVLALLGLPPGLVLLDARKLTEREKEWGRKLAEEHGLPFEQKAGD